MSLESSNSANVFKSQAAEIEIREIEAKEQIKSLTEDTRKLKGRVKELEQFLGERENRIEVLTANVNQFQQEITNYLNEREQILKLLAETKNFNEKLQNQVAITEESRKTILQEKKMLQQQYF